MPHLDSRFSHPYSLIHIPFSLVLWHHFDPPVRAGHARPALAAQHELAFRLRGDGRLCERDRGADAARLGTRLGVFRQLGQRGAMPHIIC